MKRILLSVFILATCTLLSAQQAYRKPVRPTKNIILMIPDGTSIGVISAARWYQIYNQSGSDRLAIDPYICGTVKTFCINAPIGDSAPTTSCYMTGIPQRAGNVAIYPLVDPENDLVALDSGMSYQPLVTILEAMKYEQKKATGLVVTVEFPHATPADCASHHYDRGKYEYLAPQMAYNNLDVVFGGGSNYVSDDMKQYFRTTGTTYIQNDLAAFRAFDGDEKIWALFAEKALPFDLDADTTQIPTIAEMTKKAIDRLAKNENGFFLMVEGSKVDYAAHSNDAIGCITEYLAFDKAVDAAIEFAKADGETTVIIVSDHGTGGFTIGNRELKSYSKATLQKLFGNVSKYKRTSAGMEEMLLKADSSEFRGIFKTYTDIDLTNEEVELLFGSKNYKEGDYMKVSNSVNMGSSIVKIMNSRTWFGFTSGGHTGEEVLLAVYHPQGDIPVGMNTNVELNQYMFDVSGLKTPLTTLTEQLFAKHTDVFQGMKCSIDKSGNVPMLTVKNGRKTLTIPAFKSVAYLNKQPIYLNSVVVYIDKNDTFYLPAELKEWLQKK